MFTYVYLGTNDLERATRFYDAAMASLGLRRCVTNDPEWDRISAGWGTYEDGGVRELALWVGKPFDQEGAPGLRPHYGPDFYAAYVRDPDGNKLAAVCRGLGVSGRRS